MSEFTVIENGLEWKIDSPKKMFTWQEAVQYCESLDFDGKGDWRLPTIQELFSIIDYSKSKPASSMQEIVSLNYWSSTESAGNPEMVWSVYFWDGTIHCYKKIGKAYLKAVRTV